MIKLFVSDIDGTLTDGKLYFDDKGLALKSFNAKDGRGFNLVNTNSKVLTAIITDYICDKVSKARANSFCSVNFFKDGTTKKTKLEFIKELCAVNNIFLYEVAYIGDDSNDIEVFNSIGIKACPVDSHYSIINIPGIRIMQHKGGEGAVRDFIDYLFESNLMYRG